MGKIDFKIIFLKKSIAFLHDLLWIPVSLSLAYWLRFNFDTIPNQYLHSLLQLLFFAVPVQGFLFWIMGLYRGFWRFASIPDLIRIFKAVGLGALLITLVASVVLRMEGVPRSVLFLYPILLAAGLSLSRLTYRWLKDSSVRFSKKEGKRSLIIGAGRAGELLVRDLLHRPEYLPVAFLDDDPNKQGREIHRIRVVGNTDSLEKVIKALGIELVLLAMPSADQSTIKKLVSLCNKAKVQCKTLPSLFEMREEDIDANRLRSITVEDLLGREVIKLDNEAITKYLYNKNVLVTGGGGSIGSELCRQIAAIQPATLIIIDNSEFNLYSIDHELRKNFSQLNLVTVLGDIKNEERINWVFTKFAPQVVFHAAAYKHVPMLEHNPAEAVTNNVLGTKVVADAADRYKADRFVLVSTDKAVNPANVMGTTKRIAELYCQNLNERSKTKFITTRFGNVLGSAGSVVPLFEKQIQEGGPVTVTHSDITRYFMTIPEAVSLILQAGAMGKGGEIFVLDMGEPVLIRELAEQMIRLAGLIPDKDIKIIYTGLRPGEKLYEEIFHQKEDLRPTNHEKLLLAKSRRVNWEWLQREITNLHMAASERNISKLKEHLKNIVPECNIK